MNQPLAYVHPGAKIAKNVVIDPFTTIHNNVIIGEGTWIGSNVTIMEGARIGKNCNIFPGAVISATPQDLKYKVTIRECVTINRGTTDRMKTVIGDNCLIMAYCHIAHDCIVGKNCIFSNNSTLAGHITVGDYVVLAGMTAVHQFCSIGNHAFVTGGSLVRKDVPPFVNIQDIYRILYQKNYNNTQAAEIIEAEMEATHERDEILQFIKDSQRGIMKGYFKSN